MSVRNLESAPGDRYIDAHCIDCAASREVAPGLMIRRTKKSVFPQTRERRGEARCLARCFCARRCNR